MTVASSKLSKNRCQSVPKKNTNPKPTPAHQKKRLRLQHIKTTLVPTATNNMRLRLPILIPQSWLKLKQFMKSLVSRLGLATPKSGLVWSRYRSILSRLHL